jgi:hypothetical protein
MSLENLLLFFFFWHFFTLLAFFSMLSNHYPCCKYLVFILLLEPPCDLSSCFILPHPPPQTPLTTPTRYPYIPLTFMFSLTHSIFMRFLCTLPPLTRSPDETLDVLYRSPLTKFDALTYASFFSLVVVFTRPTQSHSPANGYILAVCCFSFLRVVNKNRLPFFYQQAAGQEG